MWWCSQVMAFPPAFTTGFEDERNVCDESSAAAHPTISSGRLPGSRTLVKCNPHTHKPFSTKPPRRLHHPQAHTQGQSSTTTSQPALPPRRLHGSHAHSSRQISTPTSTCTTETTASTTADELPLNARRIQLPLPALHAHRYAGYYKGWDACAWDGEECGKVGTG